jgi:flagellar brake protein
MQPNDPHASPARKGPPRPQDAIAPIPAAANSYEITSEDDIGDMLTILAESGEAISMYCPGTREAVLGRILSVDPEQPHFVMELNEGLALQPGKVTFVASLPTAKLQFRLTNYEWNSVPGKPQLIPMIFPETCAVLNRRSSERMETPLGANFTATFVMNGNPYEMDIYDFSLGGVGLHCGKHQAKGMLKGRKLREVQLIFGSETVDITELEIRYTRAFRSFLLGEQLHLGCMFVNLTQEEASKIKSVLDQISKAPRQR